MLGGARAGGGARDRQRIRGGSIRPAPRDRPDGALSAASDDLRFAASVAGFSDLLKGGTHSGDWHFDDALQLARGARGQDDHGYRSEFIHLIELAQSLSSQG